MNNTERRLILLAAKKIGIGHNNPPKEVKKPKERHIENDTAILPHIVADTVVSKAAHHTQSEIPLKYHKHLVDRAHMHYNQKDANGKPSQFNRLVNSKNGNKGRDTVHSFMQHWLAAKLGKEHPDLARKLPRGFANGE